MDKNQANPSESKKREHPEAESEDQMECDKKRNSPESDNIFEEENVTQKLETHAIFHRSDNEISDSINPIDESFSLRVKEAEELAADAEYWEELATEALDDTEDDAREALEYAITARSRTATPEERQFAARRAQHHATYAQLNANDARIAARHVGESAAEAAEIAAEVAKKAAEAEAIAAAKALELIASVALLEQRSSPGKITNLVPKNFSSKKGRVNLTSSEDKSGNEPKRIRLSKSESPAEKIHVATGKNRLALVSENSSFPGDGESSRQGVEKQSIGTSRKNLPRITESNNASAVVNGNLVPYTEGKKSVLSVGSYVKKGNKLPLRCESIALTPKFLCNGYQQNAAESSSLAVTVVNGTTGTWSGCSIVPPHNSRIPAGAEDVSLENSIAVSQKNTHEQQVADIKSNPNVHEFEKSQNPQSSALHLKDATIGRNSNDREHLSAAKRK